LRARELLSVLEQAITDLQLVERSVARKTLSDLQIRLTLRCCLKELRTLAVAFPASAMSNVNG
jgi:hypothetical protein